MKEIVNGVENLLKLTLSLLSLKPSNRFFLRDFSNTFVTGSWELCQDSG